MNKLAVSLNLPNILLNNVNLTSYKFYFVLNNNHYYRFLNKSVLETIYKLGIEIPAIEFFYKNKNNVGKGAHIDDLLCKDFVKLNWVYGDEHAFMEWREPLNCFEGYQSTNFAGYKYLYFPPEFTETVKSLKIKSPSLVQVGIPHTITNIVEDRWAISFTLKYNGNFITMYQAIDLFKNYVTKQ